ncbi:hypothetical protein LTR70_006810 [Exophiala xenobiotica]|uniref:Uncharacterized protein n=1 Tax=Lithohypha guttulata TaxID=1690604 RepID=A0ABR0K619_9EURO|nr:hypothetical protein LTR24_006419 [Lithohypha guttulata]KAK5315157.1 hypothetical protein LTR70_006810 [Exophiala xenobiotica]
MFSKKNAQSKLGREKATTGAVVRYQKNTAGAVHTNSVDGEMDDFVLVGTPGDEEFVVIDTPSLKLSGYTGARKDFNTKPQGPIVENGASLTDKISSTASEQLIVGTGGVSDDILCYPAGDQLAIG